MESVKDNNEQRQREATAYHEAGHAVAFLVFKHEFKTVSIIPEKGFQGILHGSGLPEDVVEKIVGRENLSPEEERLVRDYIIISLAGPASECLFTGEDNRGGSARDWFKANTYASGLGRRPEEFYEQAREFISSHWKKVEVVARTLLERHRLCARQVQEIC